MTCAVICGLICAAIVIGTIIWLVDDNSRHRNQDVILPALIDELKADPLHPARHAAFLRAIRSLSLPLAADAGRPAYDAALRILENHPGESCCKQLVLEVGRWHLGRGRPNGAPTTYDEQALLNDIL
ncbi:MAG: hypothetical protein ACREJM_16385, partial [Candidatus Saccharimonadales bacterium]